HLNVNETQAAIDCVQTALRFRPGLGSCWDYSLFTFYAGIGDYQKAVHLYRQYPTGMILDTFFPKRWDALKRSDSRVVVAVEGGPGDELRFSCLYQDLREKWGDKVTVTCDPRLLSVMKRSFPEF